MARLESRILRMMLETLTQDEGGASEVAEIAGVHRSQVSRWRGGQDPSKENQERLLALYHVRRVLESLYPRPTAEKWLAGANAHLGNRKPLDLLRQGRVAEVLAAIEQDRSDSYA